MTALLLDALAAYRLTRLVTADVIADPIRERVIEAAYVRAGRAEQVRGQADNTSWAELAIDEGHDAPKLATLVTCRWCAGMWVSVGVVAARALAPRLWHRAAVAFSLSAAAALLARLEDG